MKFKLLLCGAVLLVAGCDTPQNPYASASNYSYSYDMLPEPVPDVTPTDLDKLYLVSPTGYDQSSSTAASRGSSYDSDR
jgi:hypothetical protein